MLMFFNAFTAMRALRAINVMFLYAQTEKRTTCSHLLLFCNSKMTYCFQTEDNIVSRLFLACLSP